MSRLFMILATVWIAGCASDEVKEDAPKHEPAAKPQRTEPAAAPPTATLEDSHAPEGLREPPPAEEPSGGDVTDKEDAATPRYVRAVKTPGEAKSMPGAMNAHSIYNRLIVKLLPAHKDMTDDDLKALVEEKTRAKVDRIRGGALGMKQIVFAPVEPARTVDQQKVLVKMLTDEKIFKYVEGDRMLKAQDRGEAATGEGPAR